MKRFVWLAVIALALACRSGDDGATRGTGTIEVIEVDVAPTVPARVVHVLAQEGEAVRAGDTLVTLTQATMQADIEGRRARLAAAQAQLRDLEAGARPAEIQRAHAELDATEADALRTATDLVRLMPLAASGTVSAQQLDAVRAAARTAAGRRDAAREALRLVREGSRPERVQAARADVAIARAALAAGEGAASDLVLLAPSDGVITSRHAEPGEVLAAGESALTLGDTRRPWVRIYVDERVLPRIQVGQTVTGALDAFPRQQFTGTVVAIDTRAEFTPRVALTEDERADLLFGVKVELQDRGGMLKAGLPITVTFAGARGS